ncbi:NAD-dependent epimerase/dehydratase family protein [Kitasatospora sp. NPDC057015]|uniref:NAD-dependent epimerase/dehydratase family protein n=1 Tax=Kitasatospora sp. NPDC057015 TaxID=3346001 RepID=UPI00363A2F1D
MPPIRLSWAISEPTEPLTAWRHTPPTSTHHLVIRSGREPDPTLLATARCAAAALPDAALALTTDPGSCNAAATRLAALSGHRLAPATHERTPTAALLLPARVAAAFADDVGRRAAPADLSVLMSHHLRALGLPTYLSVPGPHGGPGPSEGDPWSPADVAALDAVPFSRHGRSLVATRTTHGWETISADRYLSRLGCNPEKYRKRLRTALATAGGPPAPASTSPGASGADQVDARWPTLMLMGLVNGARGYVAEVPRTSDWALGTRDADDRRTGISALARLSYASGVKAGSRLRPHPGGGGPARRRRPIRIAVTGADHPCAVPLAQRLADLGWEVTTLAATPARRGYPGVTESQGDPLQRAALYGALHGFTSVVHLLEPDDRLDCAPAVGRLRGGLRNILDHAGQAGVRHVVCLGGPLAVEQSRVCDNAKEGPGPDVTVFRLAPVYGPGLVEGPAARRLASRRRVQDEVDAVGHVYIGDVADAVDRALRTPSALGLFDLRNGNSPYRIERARTQFGWAPRTSLHDGARALAQWLVHDTLDGSPPSTSSGDPAAGVCPCEVRLATGLNGLSAPGA